MGKLTLRLPNRREQGIDAPDECIPKTRSFSCEKSALASEELRQHWTGFCIFNHD
jgi:hypothetical protein